jgi:hypothetical protein
MILEIKCRLCGGREGRGWSNHSWISYCVKGLMLYQGAHAVSTISQLARGSDEYRNGLGIEGTPDSVSIRFKIIQISRSMNQF